MLVHGEFFDEKRVEDSMGRHWSGFEMENLVSIGDEQLFKTDMSIAVHFFSKFSPSLLMKILLSFVHILWYAVTVTDFDRPITELMKS